MKTNDITQIKSIKIDDNPFELLTFLIKSDDNMVQYK